MAPFQLRALSVLAVVASCHSQNAGAQLRGSSAAVPAAAASQDAPNILSEVHSTDCGCNQGSCKCQQTRGGVLVGSSDQDLQLELLNHTQALDAWWAELGDKKASLQCACSGEGEDCRCMEDSDMSSSAGSNATTVEGANGSTVSEALRNETEHLMSLWLVVHGGGYRRGWGYGGYRRGWGWGGCRHVGYTGCGCRYYGCHCGHVGYGGCR